MKLVFLMPYPCLLCALNVFVFPGPIPAQLGELATLRHLNLSNNLFAGTCPPSFLSPLSCVLYEGGAMCLSCVLYVLTEFWVFFYALTKFVYLRSHPGLIGPIGEFDAPCVFPPDLCLYEGSDLLSICIYCTSTIAWLGSCMFWLGFVSPRSHPGCIGPIGECTGAAFRE